MGFLNKINKKSRNLYKKAVGAILLFVICFSLISSINFVSFPFQEAEAYWGIGDINVESAGAIIKYVREIAWSVVRKAILDRIVDQIIAWISGEGDPQFVTDWKGFMRDAGEQAGAMFLQDLIGNDLMTKLCQPNWALRINISLGKPKKFSTRAMCTFKDIGKNFKEFMNNFSNGGWKAWIKTTEGQNNPYGFYLMSLNEKMSLGNKAVISAEKEATSGGGFLSDKRCKKIKYQGTVTETTETGTWKKDGIPKDTECTQWETVTPGQIAAEGLNKSVFKDIDWLKNNETWTSYIAAITDAMVNRLVKEGVEALTKPKKDDYEGASPDLVAQWEQIFTADTTPPETIARPFTEDSVEIVVTSNEPPSSKITIYYTIDGTEPTENIIYPDPTSPFTQSSVGSKIYINPIKINSPTILKWFGKDMEGNKEGVHSQLFVPPFTIIDNTKPSTFSFAVEENKIALVTVPFEPTTIYYTTNGTEPTSASQRYIKALDVSDSSVFEWLGVFDNPVLKWFAIDKAGNSEAVQTLVISTPLSDIKDLVNPSPVIIVPRTIQANQFFRLNPSQSTDNDSTPRIVMYEWDFDNDGIYDWWIIDWNRDGVLDESQCRSGAICTEPSSGFLTGSGFKGMRIPSDALPGMIEVKYDVGYGRRIGLRVTDDEGLSAEASAMVDVQ